MSAEITKMKSDIPQNRNWNIRKCTPSDLPYVYKICFITGMNGQDASPFYNDEFLLGQYYAAPYVLYSPEFSFILEDSNKIPQGYILGCDDTLAFDKKRCEFLKGLVDFCRLNQNNKSDFEKSLKTMIVQEVDDFYKEEVCKTNTEFGESKSTDSDGISTNNISTSETPAGNPDTNTKLLSEYPAHFHIDISPAMQGQKLGHELIKTFTDALRTAGIKGVHLGVGGENQRAVNFYKKEGFEILRNEEWGFTMGKHL